MANLGSVSALTTYVNTNIEDNTSNAVTPADVRQSIINTIDTLTGEPVVSQGIKQYVALLTQTGTNAPVATVLANTLGGTVVWARDAQGQYSATLANAFTASKTVIIAANTTADGTGCYVKTQIQNTSTVSVSAVLEGGSTYSDDQLENTAVTINVYP